MWLSAGEFLAGWVLVPVRRRFLLPGIGTDYCPHVRGGIEISWICISISSDLDLRLISAAAELSYGCREREISSQSGCGSTFKSSPQAKSSGSQVCSWIFQLIFYVYNSITEQYLSLDRCSTPGEVCIVPLCIAGSPFLARWRVMSSS